MTEDEYEAELLQRKVAFEPWFPKTLEMLTEQKAIQTVLVRQCGATFGKGCYIAPNAHVATDRLLMGDGSFVAGGAIIRGHVSFGNQCSVNAFAHIAGLVRIGSAVRIAPGAGLYGFNHGSTRVDIPIKDQPTVIRGIEIGDDVWIGANAVITDGVKIGPHSIVAAGSVVTKSFPAYQVIGGNPARRLQDRRNLALIPLLRAFDKRVREQIPDLVASHVRRDSTGAAWFVDDAETERMVRPWCDAVEICSMFGLAPPEFSVQRWVEILQTFQDPDIGVVTERIKSDPGYSKPSEKTRLYDTMIVNYALECLGSHLARPIYGQCSLPESELTGRLEQLNWKDHAWGAGDWVDCYASCLYISHRYFGKSTPLRALFSWLNRACDPVTGLWGVRSETMRWPLPVNGFYRVVRGTYAQFGYPLPYPKATIDTLLTHGADPIYFGEHKGNACNFLDVVHPLWLCFKQTDYRRDEAEQWIRDRLPIVIESWIDGEGFPFDLAQRRPSLQGTEMWLTIIYIMSDLLSISNDISFTPNGVHRMSPAAALTEWRSPVRDEPGNAS